MTGGRRPVAGLLAAAALLAGVGCTGEDANSVAAQAKQGDSKNYIAGDGSTEVIAVEDRGEPVELTGTTLDGEEWSSVEARGKVLVVNVWASWCGPCDAEAPDLIAAARDPQIAEIAAFVGVNLNEPAVNGRAQAQAWGLPYPSLSDPDGLSLLALQGKAAAMPSTLVLDAEGRIGARALGPVVRSTLTGLIDDVAGVTS